MKLYEITEDFVRFMEAVEAGEIPEEAIEDTLDSIQCSFDEKADNVACAYKNLQAQAEALHTEERRLSERRKAKETQAKRLKEYLLEQLQRVGKTKLETVRNVVSVRANPPALKVWDPAALFASRPDLFTNPQPELNQTAAKAELREGAELPGCSLQRKMGVVIR